MGKISNRATSHAQQMPREKLVTKTYQGHALVQMNNPTMSHGASKLFSMSAFLHTSLMQFAVSLSLVGYIVGGYMFNLQVCLGLSLFLHLLRRPCSSLCRSTDIIQLA